VIDLPGGSPVKPGAGETKLRARQGRWSAVAKRQRAARGGGVPSVLFGMMPRPAAGGAVARAAAG
jgi:hypothetical protein